MTELAVSASEVRAKFADFLDRIDQRRVLVQKHGQDRAFLIGVRELRALEETVAILENRPLLLAIQDGMKDIQAGRVQDAREAFAELDAEFRDEE